MSATGANCCATEPGGSPFWRQASPPPSTSGRADDVTDDNFRVGDIGVVDLEDLVGPAVQPQNRQNFELVPDGFRAPSPDSRLSPAVVGVN